MKRFIIALLCVVCFSPHVMAKTHTIEVTSEPISVEYAKERNSLNEVIYDVQEKLAYKNAQMKVSEQLGIVVESLTKTRDMAYDTEVIIATTASIQQVLKKEFSTTNEGLTCHLIVNVDDDMLLKALDKAKEVAQKEYYRELSNINEQEAEEYKKQSINPTSLKDDDISNLYKLAVQAYRQEQYGTCVQYCQQMLLHSSDDMSQERKVLSLRAREYLCLSYAHMNNADTIGVANELLSINSTDFYGLYAKEIAYYYSNQYDLAIATGYEILNNFASKYKPVPWKSGFRGERAPQYTLENVYPSVNILVMALADAGRYTEAYILTYFPARTDNYAVYNFKHVAMNENSYYDNVTALNYYTYYKQSLDDATSKEKYQEIHKKISTFNLERTNNKAFSYYLKGCNYFVSFEDTEKYFKKAYLIAIQHPADIVYIDIRKRIINQILKYKKSNKDCFNDLSYMNNTDRGDIT